ncbi:MAG: NYN domain-containing protein [Candidatus Doudnabacteria bacterium]|nr:NYN domain-containing protein [Candidatus Doudnabacteria bacterium]
MRTILYIDGRNTLGKMAAIFASVGKPVPAWHTYNFKGLLAKVLEGITIDEMVFYFAKIKEHPDTKEKSQALIQARRLLKTALEKQGFKVILAGVVRGNITKDARGKEILVFKEKGVDVSIAVDMVVAACDGNVKTAVLVSSDSDLQPAIREITKRNVESIYLGFELQPNKGLTATTRRTILIRNSEVLAYVEPRLL